MRVRSAFQESGPTILKTLITTAIILILAIPANVSAQSGDASWLENQPGLQTAIGRSWMAPLEQFEEHSLVEYNEEGTPISETSWRTETASTPAVPDEAQIQMMSTLIFEFDSDTNAADALEAFNEEQLAQLQRDPRAPATEAFDPDLGAKSYGHEGVYESVTFDGDTEEMAVVYVLVQDGNIVYQLFGIFFPGNHVELASGIVEDMVTANIGEDDPTYEMNGGSTGGLWEKLNAIEIAGSEVYEVYDLEVYPVSDDAVMGDSVVVPQIDLANLGEVPGLSDSWHIAYGPENSATPEATPVSAPEGVFNIELWVLEFEDPTSATAAAFSFNSSLNEPLGIVDGGSGSFGDGDVWALTMVNSGFVRDRSLPEGDAATAIMLDGTTLYAARVYSNGPAPTPLATGLVESMVTAEPGESEADVEGNVASGGMWNLFPQVGDDQLHGLEPVMINHIKPNESTEATPTQ